MMPDADAAKHWARATRGGLWAAPRLPLNFTLDQQGPAFLAPGTGFMGDIFFHAPG